VGLRPVVLPEGWEVEVEVGRQTLVLADGDPVGVLPPGGRILIRRAPKETVLLRLPQTPKLFARLREKLGWP
jgi:NAD kinase